MSLKPVIAGSGFYNKSANTASAGAGPALKRAIAYVDLAASGSGAGVGNGIPYNDLSTAYAAAAAWSAANSNALAVVKLGVGTFSELSWTGGWSSNVGLEGSGQDATTLLISQSGVLANFQPRFVNALTLNLVATADQVSTPGGNAGGLNVILKGSAWLSNLQLSGQQGGNGADGASGDDDGQNGGDGGGVAVYLIGLRITGTPNITLAGGSGGSGGNPAGAGNEGSNGANGTTLLHMADIGAADVPYGAYSIDPLGDVYASNSYLGSALSGTWVVSGCTYLSNAAVGSWNDTEGLPSAMLPTGM